MNEQSHLERRKRRYREVDQPVRSPTGARASSPLAPKRTIKGPDELKPKTALASTLGCVGGAEASGTRNYSLPPLSTSNHTDRILL